MRKIAASYLTQHHSGEVYSDSCVNRDKGCTSVDLETAKNDRGETAKNDRGETAKNEPGNS
jgi:hypothetical protein